MNILGLGSTGFQILTSRTGLQPIEPRTETSGIMTVYVGYSPLLQPSKATEQGAPQDTFHSQLLAIGIVTAELEWCIEIPWSSMKLFLRFWKEHTFLHGQYIGNVGLVGDRYPQTHSLPRTIPYSKNDGGCMQLRSRQICKWPDSYS